jgi:phospholipid transport system substrate-binding protein
VRTSPLNPAHRVLIWSLACVLAGAAGYVHAAEDAAPGASAPVQAQTSLKASEAAAPQAQTESAGAENAAKPKSASAIVEELHVALLDIMKGADKLGYQGRFDHLEPVLEKTFDLSFMAEKSAGRHWKDFNEAQRKTWLDTFERFTTANYAGRFDGYSGQHFVTSGEEPASHDTVVVRTTLVNPSDEDVQLNYRLRQTPQGWRIIDVYLHGTVSELALRRAEYSAALDREGFDKVLADLDQKVADLAAPAGS